LTRMGRKKGAIAAKAKAKREQREAASAHLAGAPDDEQLVHADGCLVHHGLTNLGNTCYFNSMVQCLNVSVPFSDQAMTSSAFMGNKSMSSALNAVFRGVRGVDGSTGSGAHNPKACFQQLTTQFPWFRGREQHDAHELLRTLLGSISDEAEQFGGSKPSSAPVPRDATTDPVARNFGGRLCAATLCWGCKRISLRLDPFFDLQLHLPSLAGQSVQAMGITHTMLTGEEDPLPPAADDAEGDSEDSDGGGKKKKKEGQAKAKQVPAAAEPKKATKSLKGVWGAARDREELRENTRQYLESLIIRVLEQDLPPEVEEEAPAEPEPDTYEVELTRQSKKTSQQWGFRWSDAKCGESLLVLCGIVEDSIVEKWNLKRRALGDIELAICIGDRLLEVNGATEYSEINKALRTNDKVELVFARSTVLKGDLGDGRAESDGEEERKREAAVAREATRRTLCDIAASCHKELPPILQEVFGPEEPLRGPAERLSLERCMQHFSTVEAIEDEFLPSYRCPRCFKEDGSKTFASRRMWVWPMDLPPLLTLQLKRFRRYRDRFEKSATSIGLAPVLDLAPFVLSHDHLQRLVPYVSDNAQIQKLIDDQGDKANTGTEALRYELYGICVHQGNSMKGGHYVAYVNSGPSLEKEKWFFISDGKVCSCSRAEVLRAEAYVAFYRREGFQVPAPVAKAAADDQDDEAVASEDGD